MELLEMMGNVLDLQGPARSPATRVPEQLKGGQGDSEAGLSSAVHVVNVSLWPPHPTPNPGQKMMLWL